MTDFFPGSRQPISGISGPPDVLGGQEGKAYVVGGREVEFFTIGQVSAALNRQPVTLRKWEREKIIPKATFSKPSKDPRGRRRLYSRAQVEALVRIAAEEGILHDMHKQISKTQFQAKVLSAFKQIASNR